MRNPNNLFLTALAVFDSCLLITAFFIYAMEYIIEYTAAFDLYVAWLTYLKFVCVFWTFSGAQRQSGRWPSYPYLQRDEPGNCVDLWTSSEKKAKSEGKSRLTWVGDKRVSWGPQGSRSEQKSKRSTTMIRNFRWTGLVWNYSMFGVSPRTLDFVVRWSRGDWGTPGRIFNNLPSLLTSFAFFWPLSLDRYKWCFECFSDSPLHFHTFHKQEASISL